MWPDNILGCHSDKIGVYECGMAGVPSFDMFALWRQPEGARRHRFIMCRSDGMGLGTSCDNDSHFHRDHSSRFHLSKQCRVFTVVRLANQALRSADALRLGANSHILSSGQMCHTLQMAYDMLKCSWPEMDSYSYSKYDRAPPVDVSRFGLVCRRCNTSLLLVCTNRVFIVSGAVNCFMSIIWRRPLLRAYSEIALPYAQ